MSNIKQVPENTESIVSHKNVKCDGFLANMGHPLVYLNMGEKDFVVCPYCSCKFIYRPNCK